MIPNEAIEAAQIAYRAYVKEWQWSIDGSEDAAMRAALSAAAPLMAEIPEGWRPSASAPKDGTPVLLGRFTGRKNDHDGFVQVDWWRRPEDHAGYIGFGRFNAEYWPPTHWIPLPAAPGADRG